MRRLTEEETARMHELRSIPIVDFTPEMRTECDSLVERHCYFYELDELEKKMNKARKKYLKFLNSVP